MSRRIRSLLVGGVVTVVCATLCLAAPAGAASLSGGELTVAGGGGINTADCTLTPAPAGETTSFDDGQTATETGSFDQTATANTDSSDVVSFHSHTSATVRSTVSGGNLTSLSMTGNTHASYSVTNPDTVCGDGSGLPRDTADFTAQADMHRSTAAWMHVQVSATGTGGRDAGLTLLDNSGGSSAAFSVTLSMRDVVKDEWIYIQPGDYDVQLIVEGDAGAALGTTSSDVKGSVRLTFVRPGTAKGDEAGTAKPMVTLPAALSCSTGKAAVKLTSKAVGASNARLYVNGRKVLSANEPGARSLSVAVPTDQNVTLRAVVKKSGKSSTATRVYRSC